MRNLILLLSFVVFAPHTVAEDSLSAPDQAITGSSVEIRWTGPGENYDSVYVLKPGQPDSASGIHSSGILNGKNPIAVMMPDEPGTFELRYWSRTLKKVMARRAIVLVDAPTSLAAADEAAIGSILEVTWESSGNAYDLVAIYPAGVEGDAKALHQATVLRKNPVIIHVPETAGDYELRYVTRQNKRVLASRPLKVTPVEASIDAPYTSGSGATLAVTWTGPGNQYDQIALFEAGAAEDAKPVSIAAITSGRNPVTVRVPEKAGDYEWRYRTAREKIVLARRAFAIVDIATALDAPASALADSPIGVGWEGPGNDYDQIQVVDPAADDTKVLARAVILSGRNPVPLNLPDVEGAFELRYVTVQTGQVLARRAINIAPAGRLSVVFERTSEMSTGSPGGSGAVELILDASGSMLQRVATGERRIAVAKTVLDQIVREFLADEQMFAMRVFGHKQADSCRTDLEVPLRPLDREYAAGLIASVNAMNLARTPIADSLKMVPNDLARAKGPKTIVLITDGEETCDGDPARVIETLRASGLDIRLSIVGFAIDDADLKAEFDRWARLGGGSYFDANSAEELLYSLRTVISGPFRVLDAGGSVIGEGIIGGSDVLLPAGIYRVETFGEPPLVIDSVEIKPRELTEAAFQ